MQEGHDAVVTFKDPQDVEHCFECVLDWGAIRNRMYGTTYGVHDGVKALREISERLRESRAHPPHASEWTKALGPAPPSSLAGLPVVVHIEVSGITRWRRDRTVHTLAVL